MYFYFVFSAGRYLHAVFATNEVQVCPVCSYVYAVDLQCIEPIR